MVIGIVTEAKDKNILKRFFRVLLRKIIDADENPFRIVEITVPYTEQQLEKMALRRILKLLKKAVKKAKKAGAEKIVLSQYMMYLINKYGADVQNTSFSNGKRLFLMLAPECIRKTAAEAGEKLIYKSVCISDSEMDRISEYLLRELCYDTKRIIVVTQNKEGAERFCEVFFEESGLLVEVRGKPPRQTDILIDVDNAFIRFGNDLYIRDIDFGYKLSGCGVKSVDVAACLKDISPARFKGIYSYNNGERRNATSAYKG